ncbi:MAG TPA: hypothetical protein VII49_07705 [Rhizomicrobium sp.]
MAVSSVAAFAADAPPAAAPAAATPATTPAGTPAASHPPMHKIVLKPSLLRGTVAAVDATTVRIKTDAGATVVATTSPGTRYAVVERRAFNQIKPTDFVGITAVPGSDGHLRAEEVHIIPMVGIGEGQYPWNHHPSMSGAAPASESTMTNGSIMSMREAPAASSMTNGTVQSAGSAELTLTYRGAQMTDGKCTGRAFRAKPGCTGTVIVDVPPATPIEAIVWGKRDDMKPGLAIAGGVGTDETGHVFLGTATLEKNGVKPEF